MPVSYLAHQVPLAPLKVMRPTWFDATALCAGSMMPDLLYAYSSADIDTNHIRTFGTHGVVFGLLLTILLRWLVVPVVASHLPDLGPARLRSLSVIDHRRPAPHITLISLAIGLCSHAALDWLTHDERRGPATLGYDDVGVTVFGWHGSLAEALQMSGSIVGIAVAFWLLHWLGRERLVDSWYGVEPVERARSWVPGRWSQIGLAFTMVLGAAAGVVLRNPDDAFITVQRIAVGTFGGMCAWSLIRMPARRAALDRFDDAHPALAIARPLPPPTVANEAVPAGAQTASTT